MSNTVTNAQMQKKAVEVLEQKLGFRPSSYKDIVLLESATKGSQIEYLLFRRYGFSRIEYHITWMPATMDYVLQIEDTESHDSMYL